MGQNFRFVIFCLFCMFSEIPVFAGISEIRDTELEYVIYDSVNPVAKVSGIMDDRLKIHILNNNEFNAFVSSGEDVYIYAGLIIETNDPRELQSVIAHELSHMQGGHYNLINAKLKQEMAGMIAMQVLGVAMMIAGGDSMAGAGSGLMVAGQSVVQQNLLSFSRDEERLADDGALKIMKKMGIPVDIFIKVLSSSRDNNLISESKISAYNINHPLVEERIRNIKEWANHNSYKVKNISKKDLDSYLRIRAKLIGYLLPLDNVDYLYPKTDDSIYANYARAIVLMKSKSYAEALNIINNKLLKKFPKDSYFLEFAGDIYYQMGNYTKAIELYTQSISNLPKNVNQSQIQQSLALALVARNHGDDLVKANEYAKKILIFEPKAPIAYRVLAGISQIKGEDGKYNYFMAEYYNLIGDSKRAKSFAKQAVKLLNKDSPEGLKARDLIKLH